MHFSPTDSHSEHSSAETSSSSDKERVVKYGLADDTLLAAAGSIMKCTDPFNLWKCELPEQNKIAHRYLFRRIARTVTKIDEFDKLDGEMSHLLLYRPPGIEGLYQITSMFTRVVYLHDSMPDTEETSTYTEIIENIHWYCSLYMERFIPSLQHASLEENVHCLIIAGDFHRFILYHMERSSLFDDFNGLYHIAYHREMALTIYKEALGRASVLSKSHPALLNANLAYLSYTRTGVGHAAPISDLSKVVEEAENNLTTLKGKGTGRTADEEAEMALEEEAEEAIKALKEVKSEWLEEYAKAAGHAH